MKNLIPSKTDVRWISWVVISAVIVYGYSLFNFTMSIDNEFTDLFAQKISIGRWGGAFLKETILPSPYSPYFTHLIFCVFLCLSAILVSKLLKFNEFYSGVFSVLCVSFPSFFYQADFAMQSDAVSIGMFLGVVSAALIISALENKSDSLCFWSKLFFSVIFYCLSISVYQSIVTTAIGVVLLFYSKSYFENNRCLNAKKIGFLIFWSVLAIVCYSGLTKFFQFYFNVPASSYLLNQVGWLSSGWDVNIAIIYNKIVSLLLGFNYYGESLFFVSSLSFFVFLAVLIYKKKGMVSVLISIASFFSPFFLVFILASDLPPRSFTFQSFVYAYFICVIASYFNSQKHMRNIAIAYCVISVWSGGFVYSKLMFSDYMSWQADKLLASQIVSEIRNSVPEYKDGITPVYFHGSLNRVNIWKPKNSDAFGGSFFQWDGGNNLRIREFMRVNMIANISSPTKSKALSLSSVIKTKPSWPEKASVFIADGIVVVKLGDHYGELGGMKPE
ncbi:glucosyltransferase domain-containing protein [Citrobacter braakii]|uniref:glucosyltransferase domain-containing protein n=1 Tax=Citrobacter braakii TaxID=57706 RepID=UPI0039843F82